jgi:branched-subunit amino acid ABC-type transport system permease component
MEKKNNRIEPQNPTNANSHLIGGFRLPSVREFIAIVAASTAIIVINSSACFGAQPIEKNIQPTSSVVVKTDQAVHTSLNSKFDLSEYSFFIATAVLIPATVLLIYSLLTRGKIGTGWKAICHAAMVATLLSRLVISIFCEITSANGIQDWDG